jgi:D-amino-acid dehydrogenase
MQHWAWLAAFLRNCTEARYNRNSERLLTLAKISMSAHAALLNRCDLKFDARQTGKLWLAPTDAALQSAIRHLPLRRHAGFEVKRSRLVNACTWPLSWADLRPVLRYD